MLTFLMAFSLVALPLTADPKKEVDRLDNCGMVLKEIMDIPDDIPSDLIDKAECVIVIPSVLKVAFAFSGSYGKGAVAVPPAGQELVALLNKKSPKNLSDPTSLKE